jgi:hypothetical protein
MKVKFVTVLSLIGVLLLVLPAIAGAKDGVTSKKKGGMTSTYKCTLTSVNASGAFGQATLVNNMRNHSLRINLNVWSLERARDKVHSAAITGFANGAQAALPGPATDTNHDGLISGAEIAAVSGKPLVWLEPWPATKRNGKVVYCYTLHNGDVKKLDLENTPLQMRAIVVYGVTQQPAYTMPFYDPTAPAAAGVIRSR